MTTILRTASYMRSSSVPCLERINDVALQSILRNPGFDQSGGERIWALLETPQTIETLCRALYDQARADPKACSRAVESLLTQLYEQDLIEVTADS